MKYMNFLQSSFAAPISARPFTGAATKLFPLMASWHSYWASRAASEILNTRLLIEFNHFPAELHLFVNNEIVNAFPVPL
jgi:hypothetical protein